MNMHVIIYMLCFCASVLRCFLFTRAIFLYLEEWFSAGVAVCVEFVYGASLNWFQSPLKVRQ